MQVVEPINLPCGDKVAGQRCALSVQRPEKPVGAVLNTVKLRRAMLDTHATLIHPIERRFDTTGAVISERQAYATRWCQGEEVAIAQSVLCGSFAHGLGQCGAEMSRSKTAFSPKIISAS